MGEQASFEDVRPSIIQDMYLNGEDHIAKIKVPFEISRLGDMRGLSHWTREKSPPLVLVYN